MDTPTPPGYSPTPPPLQDVGPEPISPVFKYINCDDDLPYLCSSGTDDPGPEWDYIYFNLSKTGSIGPIRILSHAKSVVFGPKVEFVSQFTFHRGHKNFPVSPLEEVVFMGPDTQLTEHLFSMCTLLRTVQLPANSRFLPHNLFYCCAGLHDVSLPPGIGSIRSNAFAGCVKLANIRIPPTVDHIGEGAFEGCKNLSSVDLSASSIDIIHARTFYDCTSLMDINLPSGIRTIRERAFGGCTSLTGIVLPNSVLSIGVCAFTGCWALKNLKFPNSAISIEDHAFHGCAIVSISLSHCVTLGRGSFAFCHKLKRVDLLPHEFPTITTIPSHCFDGCINLTDVNLLGSITSIGDRAFRSCTSLTVFEQPEITTIGSLVFDGCYNLTVVILPSLVSLHAASFVTANVRCLVLGDGLQTISPYNRRDSFPPHRHLFAFVTCPKKYLPAFTPDSVFNPRIVEVYAGNSSVLAAHRHRYISWALRDTIPFNFMFNFFCSINRSSINIKTQLLPPIPNELVWNILSFVQVAHTHRE